MTHPAPNSELAGEAVAAVRSALLDVAGVHGSGAFIIIDAEDLDPAIEKGLVAANVHTKPAGTNISAERVKETAENEQVAGPDGLTDADHEVIARCVAAQPSLYMRGVHEGYYRHSDVADLIDIISRLSTQAPAADDQWTELEAKAKAAQHPMPAKRRRGYYNRQNAFIAAANPATILSLIAAARAQTGEAVAWRFKSRDGYGDWSHTDADPTYLDARAYIIEPLIAHPADPAARGGEAMAKALADIQFMRKDNPGQSDGYYAERAVEIARQALAASGEAG